ncbi:unnamed protein product, partial [Amoebophrya sp. A25]
CIPALDEDTLQSLNQVGDEDGDDGNVVASAVVEDPSSDIRPFSPPMAQVTVTNDRST